LFGFIGFLALLNLKKGTEGLY